MNRHRATERIVRELAHRGIATLSREAEEQIADILLQELCRPTTWESSDDEADQHKGLPMEHEDRQAREDAETLGRECAATATRIEKSEGRAAFEVIPPDLKAGNNCFGIRVHGHPTTVIYDPDAELETGCRVCILWAVNDEVITRGVYLMRDKYDGGMWINTRGTVQLYQPGEGDTVARAIGVFTKFDIAVGEPKL